MIRPTPRAVAVFAAGIPLAFAILLADPDLWPYVPAYLFLACFNLPPTLCIGAPEDFLVRLEPATQRRPAVELLCDVDDNLEQPPRVLAPLDPEEDTLVSFPLRAKRRGQARVERLWLRWKGPLGLAYRLRVIELGNEIAVTPNTKAVKHIALQYADPMAIFDFREPKRWPVGLVRFVAWLDRPFGVTLDLAERHPWESVRRQHRTYKRPPRPSE